MFKNHPKGLLGAALSNMGERFGYYIMNAILVLFLCAKFGLSEENAGLIYSVFYCGIYILSLAGGLIADRIRNYKGTIMSGLVLMAAGYCCLAIPTPVTDSNTTSLLVFTCFALFCIAFGNGLFKGNLQAIVGQMYDKPEYSSRRDSGFQIFYMFINVGGFFAPFIAPFLRSWWLHRNFFEYNAQLPNLCHKFLDFGEKMVGSGVAPEDVAAGAQQFANLQEYAQQALLPGNALDISNLSTFCSQYLDTFNRGFHFAFIASIVAMAISLVIFIFSKRLFPNPVKKGAAAVAEEEVSLTAEERALAAKEVKQRILALFAVLGVVIFFWFSFHQNGVSLSFFARDFVNTSTIAPEIWQAVNPFFVVALTPLIMWLFGMLKKKGKEPSTPRKIAYGMGIAGFGYLFLCFVSWMCDFPSQTELLRLSADAQNALKVTPWVLIGMYFFMTVAELFISPLGLSFVSKVAPKSMQGLMQGLWLGATAVGNILLFLGGMLYTSLPLWMCWIVFVALCALSMILMLSMVKWIERVAK